jgi:hypothetical protein
MALQKSLRNWQAGKVWVKRSAKGAVYVADYAIDYIKGKRLVIKKIERGEDGHMRLCNATLMNAPVSRKG